MSSLEEEPRPPTASDLMAMPEGEFRAFVKGKGLRTTSNEAVDELLWQVHAAAPGIGPVREFAFAKPRRFRFDLAWPEPFLVAVEVDGGTWIGGRHSTGSGIEKDCEKYSLAAGLGWRIVRVTPRQVRDGQALDWVLAALRWHPEA